MKDWARYYEKSLYSIQNGVLNLVKNAKTPFFLTGGTALSRHYTFHRYSDDLDFFVISNPHYSTHVTTILQKLSLQNTNNGLSFDLANLIRGKSYTQLFVTHDDHPGIELKVEFINDLAVHYGEIVTDRTMGRIDSIRNILSNKLTALFRSEPKDVTDIHAIALSERFNWREIVKEAKTKEAGIEPEIIYDILKSFPINSLASIKWIARPSDKIFQMNIQTIADDILHGRENSLQHP